MDIVLAMFFGAALTMGGFIYGHREGMKAGWYMARITEEDDG